MCATADAEFLIFSRSPRVTIDGKPRCEVESKDALSQT